jgi:hypothetical protein
VDCEDIFGVGLLFQDALKNGTDGLGTLFFEGDAEAADAAEEIDEARLLCPVLRRRFLDDSTWLFTEGFVPWGGFLRNLFVAGVWRDFLSGHSRELVSQGNVEVENLSRTVARMQIRLAWELVGVVADLALGKKLWQISGVKSPGPSSHTIGGTGG